jgi:hypothetical protein
MNIKQAHKIAKHVAKIAEVAATFYAQYGSDYKMTENSPKPAWELYREFMARQAKIVKLLDETAIHQAHVRWEPWWERRDVMNIALVNHLSSETFRLIERAAYLDALREDSQASLIGIQETIAGLLHPKTRHKALGQETGDYLEVAS